MERRQRADSPEMPEAGCRRQLLARIERTRQRLHVLYEQLETLLIEVAEDPLPAEPVWEAVLSEPSAHYPSRNEQPFHGDGVRFVELS